MSDTNLPITFHQLLSRCNRIEVPLIQRDYAQGRASEKEVRDHFLKSLHDALVLPAEETKLPLNLDFVYGSMEDGDIRGFFPLDGQQRLTTLFLLHWYLAWCDGKLSEFLDMLWDGKHSRFTYGVRPSSTEFFDELVRYVPDAIPDEVPVLRGLIENQPWFFLHWRLDPTIQSALLMLEAIHGLFKSTLGLFTRLIDKHRPAITFQLLPLENFGLSDDLYIKMNARGKPLTLFETFKARFEELLKELFPFEKRKLGDEKVGIADFFESRIDTQWTAFFWNYKNRKTNTFDDAVINMLLTVARISLDPTSSNFNEDTMLLRVRQLSGTFSFFHEHGWLTRSFSYNLISVLEAWSSGLGKLIPVLPNTRYFDEAAFFQKAIQEPATLDYTQLVQFAAFVFYLRHHEGSIETASMSEWMRVVFNLSSNTEIERPEDYGRCLAGLKDMLPYSAKILEHLSTTDLGPIGFSPQQVREETLKAKLLLSNSTWRVHIENAEKHEYFSGQIDFLLEFCGAIEEAKKVPVSEWDIAVHSNLQLDFTSYLNKAQITFSASGLAPTKPDFGKHLWKRALLSVANYPVFLVSNYSFLTDPPSNGDSWKRFLRGLKSGHRGHLKVLWDNLDASVEIEPQLNKIINDAANLEPWRAAIVKYPEIIEYCGKQQIRREGAERIYLLRKTQMNGTHAELFSYVLYLELVNNDANFELAPLRLSFYESVYMSEYEPRVLFAFERSGHSVRFAVESEKDQFRIYVNSVELVDLPEVKEALCGLGGFTDLAIQLTLLVPRSYIHPALRELSQILANLPG